MPEHIIVKYFKKISFYFLLAIFCGFLGLPFFTLKVQAQNNFSATCHVAPLAVFIGEQAFWQVSASGGTGFFTYHWSGDEGLSGYSELVAKSYNSPGIKDATVEVFSGEQTVISNCTLEVKELSSPLSATCFPEISVVPISQKAKWIAEATGGTGSYKYSWSGDDELTGSGKSQSKVYDSFGIKQATVSITSGSQSMLRTCSVNIVADPPLLGKCYPDTTSVGIDEPIIWTAEASGGTGEYSFRWSGDENLSGRKQTVSKTYGLIGFKTGNVVISSGSQNIVSSCFLNVGSVLGDFTQTFPGVLSASCSASPLELEIGEQTQFSSKVSGGSGSYEYLWSGTENLSGDSQTISKIYNRPGFKTATLTIKSDRESTVSVCTVQVYEKGALSKVGGIFSIDLPDVGGISGGWRVFYFFSLVFILVLFLIVFMAMRKKTQEQKKRELIFAFSNNGADNDVCDIVQEECRKRKVLISTDAIKELIEKSEKDILKSLKNLQIIIGDIKEPSSSIIYGEESWPVIDKKDTEKHFLNLGLSGLTDH